MKKRAKIQFLKEDNRVRKVFRKTSVETDKNT